MNIQCLSATSTNANFLNRQTIYIVCYHLHIVYELPLAAGNVYWPYNVYIEIFCGRAYWIHLNLKCVADC